MTAPPVKMMCAFRLLGNQRNRYSFYVWPTKGSKQVPDRDPLLTGIKKLNLR